MEEMWSDVHNTFRQCWLPAQDPEMETALHRYIQEPWGDDVDLYFEA